MTSIAIETREQKVAPCPACGKGDFTVTHLLTDEYRGRGPWMWYCDDCGSRIKFDISEDETMLIGEPTGESKYDTVDLLRLPMPHGSLLFFVKGMDFLKAGEKLQRPDQDLKAFRYEENTCATNWLDEVTDVAFWPYDTPIGDAEGDAHGPFQFVGSIAASDIDGAEADLVDVILSKFGKSLDKMHAWPPERSWPRVQRTKDV